MFGYDVDELIGNSILNLLDKESQALLSDSIMLGNYATFEAIGIRKGGQEFAVEIFTKALPEAEGLLVTALRDVTERRSAQTTLALEKQRLEQQYRRQAALASIELGVDQPGEVFTVLDRLADTATNILPQVAGIDHIMEANTEEFLVGATTVRASRPGRLCPRNSAPPGQQSAGSSKTKSHC